MPAKPVPVIVTDLDGTLLDHDSYSFAPARSALKLIAERGYPLILNSSKTRAEMCVLQGELGLSQASHPHPFIYENGAAVLLPPGRQESGDWFCQAFAPSRSDWLPWIHKLRAKYEFQFSGFCDWTTPQLAEITGLGEQKAALAARRDYSEPLQWHGSEASRQAFEKMIAAKQLRLVRGGRFFSLQGQFDKARAMLWLKNHYEREHPVITIALGDSPNDCAMLNAADIAVVVQSAQSTSMIVTGPKKIIRTTSPGPEGWQHAITSIISELDSFATSSGNT